MISALILVPVLFTPTPCATHSPTPAPVQADAAYEKRLTGAGEDPDKLWELVIWCESTERDKESRIVLRRLVKLEPTHRRAHEKLGHIEYGGRWPRAASWSRDWAARLSAVRSSSSWLS